MNSLEWRLKKLEERLVGNHHQGAQQGNIFDQLKSIADHHKSFIESEDQNYARFVELYSKHRELADSANVANNATSISSRADLVLAYEDDLTSYMKNLKKLAEKADSVLDTQRQPDLSEYDDRLSKLKTITKEQLLESKKVDEKTEELIQVYNDLIGAFKKNMVTWDSSLRDA